MARIATPKGGLGTWEENENPGAGSQTVKGSLGLNDNWLILDDAVFTEHNADGTHKSTIIGKAQLKTDVADGSTLELDGTNGLQAKDGGITGIKLNANVIDDATIGRIAYKLYVKNNSLSGTKLIQTGASAVVDESTLEFSTNKIRVKDAGLTGAKLAHDNTRTKQIITFKITASDGWMEVDGTTLSTTVGIPAGRDGYATKLSICGANGSVVHASHTYGATGNQFLIGNRIGIKHSSSGSVFTFYVNGADDDDAFGLSSAGLTFPVVGNLELEFA